MFSFYQVSFAVVWIAPFNFSVFGFFTFTLISSFWLGILLRPETF